VLLGLTYTFVLAGKQCSCFNFSRFNPLPKDERGEFEPYGLVLEKIRLSNNHLVFTQIRLCCHYDLLELSLVDCTGLPLSPPKERRTRTRSTTPRNRYPTGIIYVMSSWDGSKQLACHEYHALKSWQVSRLTFISIPHTSIIGDWSRFFTDLPLNSFQE
jgi:hypothetical protein